MGITDSIKNLFNSPEQNYIFCYGTHSDFPEVELPFIKEKMSSGILSAFITVIAYVDSSKPFSLDSNSHSIIAFNDFPEYHQAKTEDERKRILENKIKNNEYIYQIPILPILYCLDKHNDEVLPKYRNIPEIIIDTVHSNTEDYEKYIQSDTIENLVRKFTIKGMSNEMKADVLLDQFRYKGHVDLFVLLDLYKSILQQDSELREVLFDKAKEKINEGELSFWFTHFDIGVTPEIAKKGMEFYVSKRYITIKRYDADYAEDKPNIDHSYCYDWLPEIHNTFDSNLLSVKDWHDIASIDTNFIKHLPTEIRENPNFWEPICDLIGKGSYINGNSYSFDEQEVFSYLPQSLKTDETVLLELLKQKVFTLDAIPNPTERMYREAPPENYIYLPEHIRKRPDFYDKAMDAVRCDGNSIRYVPLEIIDKKLIQEAIKDNFRLMSDYYEYVDQKLLDHFLTGKFLETKHSPFSSRNDTNLLLYFTPPEFLTKENCLKALSLDIRNFKYISEELQEEVIKEIKLPDKMGYRNIITPTITKEELNDLCLSKTLTLSSKSTDNKNYSVKFSLKSTNEFLIHSCREEIKQSKGLKI